MISIFTTLKIPILLSNSALKCPIISGGAHFKVIFIKYKAIKRIFLLWNCSLAVANPFWERKEE